MPLVSADLIRLVIDRGGAAVAVAPVAQVAPVAAVAPVGPGGLQPLCALYRAACLPEIRERLHSDDRSLHGLLAAMEAVQVSPDEVATVVDPDIAFWNVNTEEDGARAAELLAATMRSGR